MASKSLKESNMVSNVPYSIKENANIINAIEIGLKLCDDKQEFLNNRQS